MDEHDTIDLVIRMEIKPGTEDTTIVNAMISAAERVNGVLAAWHQEGA